MAGERTSRSPASSTAGSAPPARGAPRHAAPPVARPRGGTLRGGGPRPLSAQGRLGAAERPGTCVGEGAADRDLDLLARTRPGGRQHRADGEERGGGGAPEGQAPEDRPAETHMSSCEQQQGGPGDLTGPETEPIGVEGDQQRQRSETERDEGE